MSWRRILYNLMYRFSAPRWDTGITPPEVVAVIEGAAAVPAGRALDLGCGTGTSTIYLARHRRLWLCPARGGPATCSSRHEPRGTWERDGCPGSRRSAGVSADLRLRPGHHRRASRSAGRRQGPSRSGWSGRTARCRRAGAGDSRLSRGSRATGTADRARGRSCELRICAGGLRNVVAFDGETLDAHHCTEATTSIL